MLPNEQMKILRPERQTKSFVRGEMTGQGDWIQNQHLCYPAASLWYQWHSFIHGCMCTFIHSSHIDSMSTVCQALHFSLIY